MKLNGWQRLWVIGCVIGLIVIISNIVYEWPTKKEITSQWAYDTIDAVRVSKDSVSDIREAYKDYSDDAVVNMIHKTYTEQKYQITFGEIDKRYANKIKNLPIKQTQHVLAYIGIYLFYCPFVYASVWLFVWIIKWVYRGFMTKEGRL